MTKSLPSQAKKHYKAGWVVATAGPHNQEFMRQLGADETVDYTAARACLRLLASCAGLNLSRCCRRTLWKSMRASPLI